MRIFCDMDMVLVHQTSSEGFDRMPWFKDGKLLWEAIKGRAPILLTQVRESRFGLSSHEKLVWIKRELGVGTPVIFTPDSVGKGPHARPGDVLIDDSVKHCADWRNGGGSPILHRSLTDTLSQLNAILK